MTQSILLLNPTRVEAAEDRRHTEQVRALASAARRGAPLSPEVEITVRALHEPDRPAIQRLAGLDSAEVPVGNSLGAEIDGVLVAMLSLDDGSVIADPFRPTSSATELLRLRARQLGAGGQRRRLPRLRRRPATPRSRGALAGSPPGDSRLLEL
jgi:hypothetical protein